MSRMPHIIYSIPARRATDRLPTACRKRLPPATPCVANAAGVGTSCRANRKPAPVGTPSLPGSTRVLSHRWSHALDREALTSGGRPCLRNALQRFHVKPSVSRRRQPPAAFRQNISLRESLATTRHRSERSCLVTLSIVPSGTPRGALPADCSVVLQQGPPHGPRCCCPTPTARSQSWPRECCAPGEAVGSHTLRPGLFARRRRWGQSRAAHRVRR